MLRCLFMFQLCFDCRKKNNFLPRRNLLSRAGSRGTPPSLTALSECQTTSCFWSFILQLILSLLRIVCCDDAVSPSGGNVWGLSHQNTVNLRHRAAMKDFSSTQNERLRHFWTTFVGTFITELTVTSDPRPADCWVCWHVDKSRDKKCLSWTSELWTVVLAAEIFSTWLACPAN